MSTPACGTHHAWFPKSFRSRCSAACRCEPAGFHQPYLTTVKHGDTVLLVSNNLEGQRLSPEERREQILRVASSHFTLNGFDAVSVRDIAVEAGVTRALVYHYFPGKDALLDAVLRREGEALLAGTAPDPALSRRTNLERALNTYLDFFSASGGQLRDLYTRRSSPVAQEISLSNHRIQVERILNWLEIESSALSKLAVAGWLGFVEEVARGWDDNPDLDRAQVTQLCLEAITFVTKRELDDSLSITH